MIDKGRMASVLGASMLVLSLVAVGATGTGAAQSDLTDDDEVLCNDSGDEFFVAAINFFEKGQPFNCLRPTDISSIGDSADSWNTIDREIRRLDNLADRYDLLVQEYESSLSAEGVQTYRNAILNGSDVVSARADAIDAVKNMSDNLAYRMVSSNNLSVNTLAVAAQNSDRAGLRHTFDSSLHGDFNYNISTVNKTLPGSNDTVKVRRVDSNHTDGQEWNLFAGKYVGHEGTSSESMGKITTESAKEDGNPFSDDWSRLQSHTETAINNVINLDENTNSSDFSGNSTLPPSEMARYAAQNHTGYSAALLSQMGKSMELDQKVTVRRPSGNYSGILGLSPALKSEPQTDNLSVGDSFNLDNLNGSAYFVDLSGDQYAWTDGSVELVETSGSNSGIDFERYSYEANQDPSRTLAELRNYSRSYRNSSHISGSYGDDGGLFGGGGGLFGGPLGVSWIVWIIGGGFVLLLARD